MLEEKQILKRNRVCPVCHAAPEKARLFIEKNIDTAKLSEYSYASRKEPEYMCYRLMKCGICDVVYANQPPSEDYLAQAYLTASYDSSEEARDAAATYIHAIRPTLEALMQRRRALEIGTGNGCFLDQLLQSGFREVVGVEPSPAAISTAPEHLRGMIHEGFFDVNNFALKSFDLVCCFMTMEHVLNPNYIANSAFRLLRSRGAFVAVTHDYRNLVNRLLNKRSPIVDIEHLQLFSKCSVQYLFESAGFTSVTVKSFVNTYSIQYWVRLMPLPRDIKTILTRLISTIGIASIKLGINMGNIMTIGYRDV